MISAAFSGSPSRGGNPAGRMGCAPDQTDGGAYPEQGDMMKQDCRRIADFFDGLNFFVGHKVHFVLFLYAVICRPQPISGGASVRARPGRRRGTPA